MILRGARQVGKTSAVRIFGQEFDNFIELNLEQPAHRQIFQRGLPLNDLWQAILLVDNTTINRGETLLLIDEIQNAPEAVAYLRYFHEQLPHLHVISAG